MNDQQGNPILISAIVVWKVVDTYKASMVSNLLVVLCADESARPVINAGTIY